VRLQSGKKINLGEYGPVFLAFFAVTSLWGRRCNLFSDKPIEQIKWYRTSPPVGPCWDRALLGLGRIERSARNDVPFLAHIPVWPVIGYSPLWSQSRNVSVTRISGDPAPAGLIRIPRSAYQRLLTSQRVLAR
jgi:hypothetical protein